MRITGGTLRGRKLLTPEGDATRPTSDRVREALFNIIVHKTWFEDERDVLEGAKILDAFAGTGALGLEALSRGAESAVFFDKSREACALVRENAKTLGIAEKCHCERIDATLPTTANEACTLIFLDPPYKKGLIAPTLAALLKKGWIAPEALIVIETSKAETIPPIEGFTSVDERAYGDTKVLFWIKSTPVE